MIFVFGRVHHDGEAGGNGGNDKKDLRGDGGKVSAAGDDEPGNGGRDEKFQTCRSQDVSRGAADGRAAKISADDDGHEDDEGAGEMFEDRPNWCIGKCDAGRLRGKSRERRVERGHFIEIAQETDAGNVRGTNACGRDDIDGDIHQNHEENDVAAGFGKERRFIGGGVRRVAVNENDERAADVSRIGIRGGGAEDGAFSAANAEQPADERRKRTHRDEEQNFRRHEQIRFFRRFVLHHGEENKARQHDVDDEFIVCFDVQRKLGVQKEPGSDKEEQGEDVVTENLDNVHFALSPQMCNKSYISF